MVKQKKQAKPLRDEAEWKNIYIKRDTAKELLMFKIEQDLLTYDQAVRLLLNNRGTK